MIYNGDYENNFVYGTAVNNKIKVTKNSNATFLLVSISVSFNTINWNHDFEIPFFENAAEFYFENYIHSIIIDNMSSFSVDVEDISAVSFAIASVGFTIKEMHENDELSTQQFNFYMSLGVFDAFQFSELENGKKILLPTYQPSFITDDSLLAFSFFSNQLPQNIKCTNKVTTQSIYSIETEVALPVLHTVFIPVKKVTALNYAYFSFEFLFSEDEILQTSYYSITQRGLDFSLFFYQNNYGTISTIEFTGKKILPEDFKINNELRSDNGHSKANTSSIANNSLITLDTGLILSIYKYHCILEMLRSFNIFLYQNSINKVVVNGNQKLTPYESQRNFSSETLNFKLAKNDNIHYRHF